MNQALRVIIFVLVMGTVSGSILFGVNSLTAGRIAHNEELKLKTAFLEALDIAYPEAEALKTFAENVEAVKKDDFVFYRGKDQAAAFEFKGPGLWGPIYGIISLNPDLKTVRRIRILHQEETPGLGARIADNSYLNQFKNKEFVPSLVFTPAGSAKANNEVDAITGATGSSKALEKLLNDTIQKNIDRLRNA